MAKFECRRFAMTARAAASGWRIEIVHRDGGDTIESGTFRDISAAIDDAKRIVRHRQSDWLAIRGT